jgi:hypothetical protein
MSKPIIHLTRGESRVLNLNVVVSEGQAPICGAKVVDQGRHTVLDWDHAWACPTCVKKRRKELQLAKDSARPPSPSPQPTLFR